MESFENRRCLCVFVTVCDNPSKCVFNIQQFAYVENGQTPEERVAVINQLCNKCQNINIFFSTKANHKFNYGDNKKEIYTFPRNIREF